MPAQIEVDHVAIEAASAMSAIEIICARGHTSEQWLIELGEGDKFLRIWGETTPLREHQGEWEGGEWDDTHRPLNELITLHDGMRFATIPPCGY